MATLVTCVIDPGGTGDYPSMNTAEAAHYGATGADLVSNDEYVVCRCICTNGTADTNYARFYGRTVDATHNVYIYVDPDYKHQGVFPSSGNIYRIDHTIIWGYVLAMVEDHMILDGVAVKGTATGDDQTVTRHQDYINGSCRNCIITGTDAGFANFNGLTVGPNAVGAVQGDYNNIVYGFSGTGGLGIQIAGNNEQALVLNNTVADCTIGIEGKTPCPAGNVIINNVVVDCTTAYAGTFHSDSKNNAYCNGADPATAGTDISGYAVGDLVEDAANNLYLFRNGNPMGANGTNLYNYSLNPITTDILGQARASTGTDWCLGANVTYWDDPSILQTVDRKISAWSLGALFLPDTYHP